MNLVDNDAYSVNLAGDSSVILRMSITGPAPAGVLLLIDIADTMGVIRSGLYVGNHAVMAVNLAAGTYVIEAFAVSMAAPATAVPYKLAVSIDNPMARCGMGGAATFTEANDGVANNGNDMMEVRFGAAGGLTETALPTDVPEPSAVILAATGNSRLDGTIAQITPDPADEYDDRDTFVFTTGPMTNEVSVRLDWPGMDADVDFFFMPVPMGMPPQFVSFMSGLLVGDSGPEFGTHAVLPDTQYWVWVGAYQFRADQATPPTLPKTYSATLCGVTTVPAP